MNIKNRGVKCSFLIMKDKFIKLRDSGVFEIVPESIYCILSDGNYIKVYYEKGNGAGQIHSLGSLNKLIKILPTSFYLYNRFNIVNLDKLAVIEKGNSFVFRNGYSLKIRTGYTKK